MVAAACVLSAMPARASALLRIVFMVTPVDSANAVGGSRWRTLPRGDRCVGALAYITGFASPMCASAQTLGPGRSIRRAMSALPELVVRPTPAEPEAETETETETKVSLVTLGVAIMSAIATVAA